jgi:hypothetical protein
VYIQEGPPQLASMPPAARAKGRASGTEEQLVDPVESGRHAPGVEDFPPHAQREYWAKSGESHQRAAPGHSPFVYQRQPEPAPAKISLLRRLASAARGRREEEPNEQLQKHSYSRSGADGPKEQVDLPVFFDRGKR